MSYAVKEIFYSVQGEGANLGRPAIFCRFAGCNIWSGREDDKSNSICRFCDTDFVGTDGVNGGKYSDAESLARKIDAVWRESISLNGDLSELPLVIFTGGEPTLQLDSQLTSKLKSLGYQIAIETNGTALVPSGVDWITVSPKVIDQLAQRSGDELKLLFPFDIKPEQVEALDFKHFYLSPICEDDPGLTKINTEKALNYCLRNPKWKMTLQYHKILGVQ